MNLYEVLGQLSPTSYSDITLPTYLLGCFRRKSITFFNGLTDETTIVYWFQSKSFTIDLRLTHTTDTPILQRQGWIGTTIWDNENQLLSWDIRHSYQLHNQWPEPAKLLPIGNAILEFAPSGAYVEDWRQQANQGIYCGLRIYQAEHVSSKKIFALDGGFVIAGDCIAYAQTRLPKIQAILDNFSTLQSIFNNVQVTRSEILSYEVSIALTEGQISYSTQSELVNHLLNLDGFGIEDGTIFQYKKIDEEVYKLYFKLDCYFPDFTFVNHSPTTSDAFDWFNQEQVHLNYNAQYVK